MLKVRLKNLRCLGDTGNLPITPITVLVGMNSGGKSTFTRFFPLLRQSISAASNAPLLWYGNLVDFGSVSQSISRLNDDNYMEFEINVSDLRKKNKTTPTRFYGSFFDPRTVLKRFSYSLQISNNNDRTVVNSITLKVNDDQINITLDEHGYVEKIVINMRSYERLFKEKQLLFITNGLSPTIFRRDMSEDGENSPFRYVGGNDSLLECKTYIDRYLQKKLHANFNEQTISWLAGSINYSDRAQFANDLRRYGREYASWNSLVDYLQSDKGTDELEILRSAALLKSLPGFLSLISSVLKENFSDVIYIGPSRATGERYYRIQELAIGEIDPQGANFPMFLHSLPYPDRRRFSDWCKEYLGYAVEAEKEGGHVRIVVTERGAKDSFNIADTGYGLSQVFPVFGQLWSISRRRASNTSDQIVAIEQPELHLHPAYQARVSDALVGAINASREGHPDRELRIVVETHSRQLINRLGELIASGKIDSKDVSVYIFDRDGANEPTHVQTAGFDEQGSLRNWPYGFFASQ